MVLFGLDIISFTYEAGSIPISILTVGTGREIPAMEMSLRFILPILSHVEQREY